MTPEEILMDFQKSIDRIHSEIPKQVEFKDVVSSEDLEYNAALMHEIAARCKDEVARMFEMQAEYRKTVR